MGSGCGWGVRQEEGGQRLGRHPATERKHGWETRCKMRVGKLGNGYEGVGRAEEERVA